MKTKHFSDFKDVSAELWRWPNFSPAEIACNGTDSLLINFEAMDKLQALRTKLGKPLYINSGYRSEGYNRKVGGSPTSQHLYGKAFDVSTSNVDKEILIEAAQEVGFTGIGRYKNFVHLDIGPKRTWVGNY